jgi:hypothetical protein
MAHMVEPVDTRRIARTRRPPRPGVLLIGTRGDRRQRQCSASRSALALRDRTAERGLVGP